MKKYIAELIGTCVLTTIGCGTAMLVGCDAANGGGYILTALAFGLSIVAMAYCVGNISGCHINPAVSLGVFMSGGMDAKDFAGYVVAQVIGGLVGAALLMAIFSLGGVTVFGEFTADVIAYLPAAAVKRYSLNIADVRFVLKQNGIYMRTVCAPVLRRQKIDSVGCVLYGFKNLVGHKAAGILVERVFVNRLRHIGCEFGNY